MTTNDIKKQLNRLPLEAKNQLVKALGKLPPERRRRILEVAAEKAKAFGRTRKGRWMFFGAIAGVLIEQVPLVGRTLNWPLWLALAGLAKGTIDDFEFERLEKLTISRGALQ